MNSHLIDSIGWTLLHFTWQGLLIGCSTAVLLMLLRNAHPRLRYHVGCAALLACVLWPAAGLVNRLDAAADVGSANDFSGSLMMAQAAGPVDGITNFLQSQLLVIVGFWALCALVMTIRMALGLAWVRRSSAGTGVDPVWQTRANHMAERFGIARTVAVRVVDDLSTPVTAGWLRPVVLLPASLVTGMPAELLNALLAHEMAHIRRLDYVVNLGQNVIEALLFYHPAVWWISGQVRAEREQLADELAAQHLAEPRQLAHALSELARLQGAAAKYSTTQLDQLSQAAQGGDLVARVRRLVKPSRQALDWKAALPVVALAAGCLAMVAHAANVQAAPTHQHAVADFSSCKKPIWPAASLKAHHTGTVQLGFEIGPDGKVLDSRIENSSGHPALDEAARTGISLCTFKPARIDGKPVRGWMKMKYIWMLE